MNQNKIDIIKICSNRGRKKEKRDDKEMKLNSVKRKAQKIWKFKWRIKMIEKRVSEKEKEMDWNSDQEWKYADGKYIFIFG